MAREFPSTSFFNTPPNSQLYYAAQIPIEYFLADVLMRHDVSRVIWASDDYSFRRRMELAPYSPALDTTAVMSLQLPFINYWYVGFWEPDDRVFSQHTQQMVFGTWEAGLPSYLKAMPVKTTFTATAMYSRDSDARVAYNALMWEFRPKGPILLSTTVTWKGRDIAVPVYVTLEQPQFNPTFNEVTWLAAQKIVPIKFNFTVRTYLILPNPQNLLDNSSPTDPTPPFNIHSKETSEDVSISASVILEFACRKNLGELNYDANDVNPYTLDIVEGYLNPAEFNIAFSISEVTSSSAKVAWSLPTEDLASFSHLEILIPGQPSKYIENTTTSPVTIENLYPSSLYELTILVHDISGGVKTTILSVTTLSESGNPVGVPLEVKKGKLKGIEW